ncbi:MAG TPA: DinB family protein [Gemmataceae bacterium]|nr:DinB family protein [Gemmataceae bacterium]
MTVSDLIEMLDFNRSKTLAFIDGLAKVGDVHKALAWRPGPGRAHLAWQLMHIGATDDRHVHMRMAAMPGQPADPELVRRFAGGSTPDDDIPSIDVIKAYLDARRKDLIAYLKKLDDKALHTKPNEQAPWTYAEWAKVLAWHEAHHQGQAHLTLNLYKAAHDIK